MVLRQVIIGLAVAACARGILYGARCSQGVSSIDPASGIATPLGSAAPSTWADAPGRGAYDSARKRFYELIDDGTGQMGLMFFDMSTYTYHFVMYLPLDTENLGADTVDVDPTSGVLYVMGHQYPETFPYKPRQMYRVDPFTAKATLIGQMPFNTDMWESAHAFDPVNRIEYMVADLDLTPTTWGINVDTGAVVFNTTTSFTVLTYNAANKAIYGFKSTADWVLPIMKLEPPSTITQMGTVGGFREPWPTATIDPTTGVMYAFGIKGYATSYSLLGIVAESATLKTEVVCCTSGWTGTCPYQVAYA
eukprot:TRINITY_DN3070_c0_g6_i1.p1 TRINITY_DN3070_c0_g6~~TRINITY_DN3070_c0_g6_i1.p1  ORF type:complete len:320 (+),score=64.07 TRINITY_DN3070_c0_g6_i1:45-962(+)